MNKPVFIYSLHRSGSTYLKNVIGASAEIKMLADEVQFDHPFLSNTFKKYYQKHCQNDQSKYDNFLNVLYKKQIRGAFWSKYKSKYTDFYKTKTFLKGQLTIWNSFNSILKHVLANSSKDRLGIKYPTHYKYFEEFNLQYFEAKNIFLIRDPRAIIASKIMSPTNKRLNKAGVPKYEIVRFVTVLYFSIEFIFFIKQILANSSKGIIIKYEDLVLDKKRQIQKICDHCEIDMNSKMLKAEGKSSGFNQIKDKKERINRWMDVLRVYEIKILNMLTKKYRSKMGYE